jgi:hypothetical protein
MTIEQPNGFKPTAAQCKRRAKEILTIDGLRLNLILCVLFYLTFFVGGIYMVECAFSAVPWAELYEQNILLHFAWLAILFLIEACVLMFALLPMLYGVAMIFQGATMGQKVPLSLLFFAFGSARNYRRAFGVIFRLLALPAATLGLCALLVLAVKDASSPWLVLLTFFIAALLFLTVSLICCRDDAVLALAYRCPDARVRDLFAASHRITKSAWRKLLLFKLSFWFWTLMSVATLGLLTILHALPYFTIAHTLFTGVPDEPVLHE